MTVEREFRAKDSPSLCISDLGTKHAHEALSNTESCPHCKMFKPKMEPMECPQTSSLWGDLMVRVSPVLTPLFKDLLAGEKDNDQGCCRLSSKMRRMTTRMPSLNSPPNQSRLPSGQEVSSSFTVQADTDLLEVCRRAAEKRESGVFGCPHRSKSSVQSDRDTAAV